MKSFCMLVLMTLVLGVACAQPPDPAPPSGGGQPAMAPPPPATPEKEADAEVNELIQSVMAAKLSKELGLNEEQTVLMVRRFSEFREQLGALKRERQEKLKALRIALREHQPDETVERALDDLIAHDLKTLEFRKDVYQKAAGNLSVSQRAKLYVFISDFEGDMRRLIQKAREPRQGINRPARLGPPPEGPPPPGAPPRPQRLQRIPRDQADPPPPPPQ
jgi:hypothetical protein